MKKILSLIAIVFYTSVANAQPPQNYIDLKNQVDNYYATNNPLYTTRYNQWSHLDNCFYWFQAQYNERYNTFTHAQREVIEASISNGYSNLGNATSKLSTAAFCLGVEDPPPAYSGR